MAGSKWKNRPLEDEIDQLHKLGVKWYRTPKRCKNPDCRKESFCRTIAGICMACVIRQQKRGAK